MFQRGSSRAHSDFKNSNNPRAIERITMRKLFPKIGGLYFFIQQYFTAVLLRCLFRRQSPEE